MRKILVLRGGALGDFIVTLPALALLRARWPEATIELAGNATAAALARARGLLDVVHSQHEARWAALFGAAALPAELAAWLAEFDLVVNYWPDVDGTLRRRFPARAAQIFLTADAMPAQTPAAAHYCTPLKELGLSANEYFFRLESLSVVPPHEPRGLRTTIAIHPGSGSPRKNWPAERWREVIDRLGAPVLLILGEAEQEHWADFAASLDRQSDDRPEIRAALNLPLEDLVIKLFRCRLFLGHDSGMSHLAAACGVPSVLLFGPTDPVMWAPPAPHVAVIRRGASLDSILVQDVFAALPLHQKNKVEQPRMDTHERG